MAIGANNLALGDLIEDLLPRTLAEALRNVEPLVTEVIELQDERILLAAVDAASLAEEVEEIFRVLLRQTLFAPRRLCQVAVAVREEVGLARATVGMELFERRPVPGELRDRLQLAATTTTLTGLDIGHERMFAYGRNSKSARRPSGRRRIRFLCEAKESAAVAGWPGADERVGARRIEREPRGVAQSGSAPGWGPGGRRFKSCLPD